MPSGVTFGAIRWDAYWDLSVGSYANNTRAALSDAEYQFRAPIHSQVLAANVITYDCSQQAFDNEITFAAANGLHYWAYLLYPETSTMTAGIHFHMSSSIASQMKFCLMLQTSGLGTPSTYQTVIDAIFTNYVSKPFYFLFSDGTPLVYIYYVASDITSIWGDLPTFKTAIDYLKSKFLAAKGKTPYVVVLTITGADAVRVGIGADALSSYVGNAPQVIDGTYSNLDTATQSVWASQASQVSGSGGNIVPTCVLGWDNEPRIRRPGSTTGQIPEQKMRYRYALPTNTEAAAHVQSAVTYVLANPTICPKKTILCYAWNENDEGGWLTKTLGDPTGSRLAAIAPVIA